MLKPGETALSVAIAVLAGVAALVVCVAIDTGPVPTAVVPVAVGGVVMQIAVGVMKRRAWAREHAGRN